jgi:hypothetical protein
VEEETFSFSTWCPISRLLLSQVSLQIFFFSARVKKILGAIVAFVGFFEYSTANLHRWGCKKKTKIYIFSRGEHKSNDALTNDEDSLITKLSIGLSSCNEGGFEYHQKREDEARGMPVSHCNFHM